MHNRPRQIFVFSLQTALLERQEQRCVLCASVALLRRDFFNHFELSCARFFIFLPFWASPLLFPPTSHINCQFDSHFKVRCGKLLRKHSSRCVNGRFGKRMKWNLKYESRYERNEERDKINTPIISCLLFIYNFVGRRNSLFAFGFFWMSQLLRSVGLFDEPVIRILYFAIRIVFASASVCGILELGSSE